MSIITKKIGGKEYAYLVVREGKKVIHKYLGPAGSPQVTKIMRDKKEAKGVPEKLKFLFWDTSIKKIHIKRNARYIIERVLEFGDMEALNWLQRVYTVQKIIDVLSTSRNISLKSQNFWLIWFGAEDA
jgi:hypothetical protein